MKLNISYPANGSQKLIEIDDERKLRAFMEKRMGTEVPGDGLGDEFKGYVCLPFFVIFHLLQSIGITGDSRFLHHWVSWALAGINDLRNLWDGVRYGYRNPSTWRE
jgi:hypothetical protein